MSDNHQVGHAGYQGPSSDADNGTLQTPFPPPLLFALAFDEVGMFGREVRVYPRRSVLEFYVYRQEGGPIQSGDPLLRAPLLGLSREYVTGMVTRLEMVMMK